MKTIQQIIRGMDTEQIARDYFNAYPDEIQNLGSEFDDLTIKEAKALLAKQFQDFIASLLSIEPKPEKNRRGILFLSKEIGSDGIKEEELLLIHSDDLLKADTITWETVPSYAYEFTPREEAMSFLVADNKLTQDWLSIVVTKFLYEMAFFGYDESGAIEEGKELQRRAKEAEEHPERLITVTDEELLGDLPVEEIYPKEKALRNAVSDANAKFRNYCRTVELERIKESLLKERAKD